jgi:tRNA 2-thiouridine synthesizing protein A
MTKTIDARGLSCPQPVIMTRDALTGAKSGRITVLVDTMTQVYNVSRSAEKLGWAAKHEGKDDQFIITLDK